MPAFSDNARRDGDGRYRFRRGRSVDPHEELHPEMSEQQPLVGADVPDTPDELLAMQRNEAPSGPPHEKPERSAPVSDKVRRVLALIEELKTTAAEDRQIALTLVKGLEDYHDDVVNRMQDDSEAKHSQIAAWAVDADRLLHCRIFLESIDLDEAA